jgi:predicted transcriptional regulator
MINIDTRLMDLVKNKTITSDDFFILLCITKRVSKRNESFPSIEKLEEEANFVRKKVYKCLANLAENKLITKKQRHIKGRLSSNLYTIETEYLSVFISAKNEELEEELPPTKNQETESLQCTQNRHTESLQYTQNEQAENEQAENDTISINQSIEVLTNLSEGGKPSQNLNSTNSKLKEIKEGIVNNPLFELWIDSIETNNPKTKEIEGIRDLAVNDTALALLSEKKYSTTNPKNWLEISYKKLLDIHIQNQRIEKMDQKNQTNRSKVSETPILEQIDYFA